MNSSDRPSRPLKRPSLPAAPGAAAAPSSPATPAAAPRPRQPFVRRENRFHPDGGVRGPARPIGPVPRPAAEMGRRKPRTDDDDETPKESRWFSKAERDRQMAPPKPVAPSEISAGVILKADRDHPADRVLREELRRAVDLSPDNAAWLSRAVFSYYRWRGWLPTRSQPTKPMLVADVLEAARLAEKFVQKPGSIPPEELVTRVAPEWVSRELEISPDLARAWQREPTLWLRCRPGQTEIVKTELRDCAPGVLPDSLRYAASRDLFSTDLFHAGAFEIQDIASQAVSVLAAPQPGETWWDACAGEGGKTLHLGALMQGKGLVWASDRAEWRLQKLRIRAARAQCFNQRVVRWDSPTRPPTKTRFDGVLVDAPCVGLGTWGRNPHSRWTSTPQDVLELSAVQTQLLKTAATTLKPGGKLVYSVCSLTRSETTAVADAFGAAHPDFEPLELPNPFQPTAPPRAQLTLWPQDTGGNGMFVAAWRRR